MEYSKWNKLIGRFLFNEETINRHVFLYMTKDMLIDEYKRVYRSDNRQNEEIWKDFIDAINHPTLESNELSKNINEDFSSYRNRIMYLFRCETQLDSKHDYPSFLSMLVFLVMAKAETQAENTDADIIGVIRTFFKKEGVTFDESDFHSTRGNDYLLKAICRNADNNLDGGLWKVIHEWSINYGRGISYFYYTNQRYADIIADHCLLSRNVKLRIRYLYNNLGLNTNSNYSLAYFKARLMARMNALERCFNNRNTAKKFATDDILARVLLDDFETWDGTFEDEDKCTIRNCYLLTCCDVNLDEKYFNVEYRAYDSIKETITVRLENGDMVIVSPDLANWSTPLQDNQNIRVVSGNQHRSMRFIFNNNEDGIYFVRLNESFPGRIMVATDNILYDGAKVFFVSKKEFDEAYNFHKLPLTNDNGYKLYSYDVSFDDAVMNGNGILAKYRDDAQTQTHKGLEFIGGLRLDRSTYLPQYLPCIYDYQNHDELYIKDLNHDKNAPLLPINESQDLQSCKIWKLPENLPQGRYRIGGNLDLIICDNTQVIDHDIDYPCFTKEGNIRNEKELQKEKTPYSKDGHIWTGEMNYLTHQLIEDNYPSSSMCHKSYASISAETADFEPIIGDVLIEWLYYRGKCSKGEFITIFNTLQSIYVKSINYNPGAYLSDGYRALRWLANGSFIDIDKNGNVIPCSPRFVCLPVERDYCNKFHLMGCRPIFMVKKLQHQCRAHREMLAFQFYQTNDIYLMNRLAPSSIFIEANGNEANDYGFENVQRYLCNDHLIYNPKPGIFTNMFKFMPRANDVENNTIWYPLELHNYSTWGRCCNLFRIEDYRYTDQSFSFDELNTIVEDIAFVRIEVRRNQYRFVVYDIKNSRYSEVSDLSLAKHYVIGKVMRNLQNKSIIVKENNGRIQSVAVACAVGLPSPYARLLDLISLYPATIHYKYYDERSYYIYTIKDNLNASTIKGLLDYLTKVKR